MNLAPDVGTRSLAFHELHRGKIATQNKTPIESLEDLSLVYTPGVGTVSRAIAENPVLADRYTWRKNTVAVISDGSAVLGLGNIGPEAALPVIEGKCAIFKRFANIDAVPIVLATQDPEEVVRVITALTPSFGAIQLEDISAPRCFAIEQALHRALPIPVMHDDQHGTAIVALAGLTNALRVVKKELSSIRLVINGAGAAGVAIGKLLHRAGVREIVVCDRSGAISLDRADLTEEKRWLAELAPSWVKQGMMLQDVAKGADVLLGVSVAGAFTTEMVQTMTEKRIVIGLANPVPEMLPEAAKEAGVTVLATGRSDFPNQMNNSLCYPGLFRGMLDHGVTQVTDEIKMKAAAAIASMVPEPTPERIIPTMFDEGLHERVAACVKE